MKLDDLTLHLPAVPASWLHGPDGGFQDTDWARQCLAVYERMAERALAMHASLSLENLYNKSDASTEEDLLSSRPWHLLRLVDHLRGAWNARGRARETVDRIGILFDAGHAFRDPRISKVHGLGDWLGRIGPRVRMLHVHQVLVQDGKTSNHHAIRDLRGPYINYAGLLPLVRETVPRRVPLLIEVRDMDDAILSWRVLTGRVSKQAGSTS
jgi:sugar phosphate isomerase/epimerase